MTEVEVNGKGRYDMDFGATKSALSSSSTSVRLGQLHTLEESLLNKGILIIKVAQSCTVLKLMLTFRTYRNRAKGFPTSPATLLQYLCILP
jgi:hypothetical protein